MKETRIFDLLTRYIELFPNKKIALAWKKDNVWVEYGIKEYVEIVNNLSYAFIKLGIKPKDKIAIISHNRPEWNMLDMAIMQIGAITVPIYPKISERDYHHILNHSDAKLVVVETDSVIDKIENIINDVPSLDLVYTLGKHGTYPTFEQLVDFGETFQNPIELADRRASINSNDLATIIYTSGTIDIPKGVMLSHSNILNQIANLKHIPDPKSNTAISFLPLSHVYERMMVFLYQYLGMSIYYLQSTESLSFDMRKIKPTMFTMIPRIIEEIYNKVLDRGKRLKGINRITYMWAINLANNYEIEDSKRTKFYNFEYKIADKLVYSKIRKLLVGSSRFDIMVSGGDKIREKLAAFFSAIGLPVFEGYGLTEASPVIAVSNRAKDGREAGTVGTPLNGVEVKIAENGELLCRGHNVMLGYYKNEELTKQVIDEKGWLKTGDLAEITEKGQIIIHGRMTDMIKLSSGTIINPVPIELKLSESRFIKYAVVCGENRDYPVALINPDFIFLEKWCEKHDINYKTKEDIINNSKVYKRYIKTIDKYNSIFNEVERVKKFELISDEWTLENNILSPLNIRRYEVLNRYKDIIDKLYL
ncbi:long-chain fatty acid--CoA ligase [Bacteroidales bacterium OttesenSCG-928-K03]|nr:long-chain fatty acid--CoA ligase [Odoribacter sp. OttesenSCG-928-L07]MDL2239801.1 long-chain fatty acid--CoA ligase [Bacteroidales bacterium OttesenSCG-928-L14]MDL2243072.1 long-chain fatty acid--CoA ligase [Bacteroidales bacterium OttesenSCG-928-K03]